MRWTVRLEARTDAGEVETTELATITRPAMASPPAEVGLMLAEAKGLLASARMNKRRQMRWSPLGAHRVLQVRAAVLDGRFGLGQSAAQLAA